MIQPEDLVEGEWADWYRLTPLERWHESQRLWEIYLGMGGSLDPEPDTQSPFFDARAARARRRPRAELGANERAVPHPVTIGRGPLVVRQVRPVDQRAQPHPVVLCRCRDRARVGWSPGRR